MEKLTIDGFRVSTQPIAEGDVALVIRLDGTVEAALLTSSEDGRVISADHDRLKTILALTILLGQEGLIEVARREVDKKVAGAMKLRVVN